MRGSIELERGLGRTRESGQGQTPEAGRGQEQGLELQREPGLALEPVALGPELAVELQPAGAVVLVARVAADGKRF